MSPARTSRELQKRLAELHQQLGYAGDEDFITAENLTSLRHSKHAFEHALNTIGVTGIMCIRTLLGNGAEKRSPAVFTAVADSDEGAAELHRLAWSQGIAPVLLVALPEGLQIRNSFSFSRNADTIPWDRVASDPRHLSGIRAAALRTSVAWRDFDPKPDARVDQHLLGAIQQLSDIVQRRHAPLRAKAELINSLIGRFLYLYILIDRGHLTQQWVDGLTKRNGQRACPTIKLEEGSRDTWLASDVWELFDAIDRVLNGAVFPIRADVRPLFSTEIINLIRSVLRSDDLVGDDQQLGFLNVRYGSVRTETISAMYELFFALQDPQAKEADGAFYTPPYLVDYVLDELDEIRQFDGSSVVLDPACGSGAFLVGAYRRVIEREHRTAGRPLSLERMRELLKSAIRGVEANHQASAVARFSLYLTLLDYHPHLKLAELPIGGAKQPLFPTLEDSIVCRDFFDEPLPRGLRNSITHVVGNPPWTKIRARTAADTYRKSLDRKAYPVAHNRLSELFVWRAKIDAMAPGGALGFLLSTKSFVSASATRFPFELAQQFRLIGMTNLWHFRYRLFAAARHPALALFAVNAEARDLDSVWVYSPLLTSQPIGSSGWPWSILMDRGAVERIRHSDLCANERSWFWSLMLQPLDRHYARLLDERKIIKRGSHQSHWTIGAFLAASGMIIGRGGSAADTNVPEKLLLGTDPKTDRYYRRALGLVPNTERTYTLPPKVMRSLEGSFRLMFGGNALLLTRNLLHFDYVREPVAFTTSIHAIAFVDDRYSEARRASILKSIASYLKSPVAKYLYALTGRLWLLDGRRFENNDMRDLPFPFQSVEELVAAAAKETDFVEHVCTAFGLDRAFADTVKEYEEFREGYQDAQIPARSLSAPSKMKRTAYVAALRRQLVSSFGRQVEVAVSTGEIEGDTCQLEIALRSPLTIETAGLPTDLRTSSEYTSTARVSLDARGGQVHLVKPLTNAAWTLDRAYADAQRIVGELLRS